MSESQNKPAQPKASKNLLPWILAGVFLLIYLGTVNRWVNLINIFQISKIAQWDWKPSMIEPVTFLITLPFRALPEASIAIGLNILSAILGAITIGLLARSIQLLPQDRTHEQRIRLQDDNGVGILKTPRAWVPVVIGVAAFGLQLSFWEHATSFSGEMVNLALFAYVIRGLLEFRAQRPQTTAWLYKVSFVFGLALTNNWAMLGFFPCLVAALVAILGVRFFNVGLLARMAGFGALGLAFYLLAPLSGSLVFDMQDSYGELLSTYLGTQRSNFGAFPKYILLICGLTSLSPLLFLSIKWPSSTGESNAAGSKLTQILFHFVHIMFLGVCLSVVFDPPYGPKELYKASPLLTLYYLGALCIGYFAGYCALVFSKDGRPQPSWKRSSPMKKGLDFLVPWALILIAVGAPIALIAKNADFLMARNKGILKIYADKLKKDLGDGPQVVFSEDSLKLILLEATLHEEPKAPESKILVHHHLLAYPEYQRISAAHYGDRWMALSEEAMSIEPINPLVINQQFQALAESAPARFLHLILNYRFEQFTPNLRGLTYEVQPNRPDFTRNSTPIAVAETDKGWRDMRDQIDSLAADCLEEIPEALLVGSFISSALNAIGVELQMMGNDQLQAAATYFYWALEINENNRAADLNLKFNEVLNLGMDLDTLEEESIEFFNNFNRAEVSLLNGPVDEIHYRALLGKNLSNSEVGMLRQAIPEFNRVLTVEPGNFQALSGMVNVMLQAGNLDSANEYMTQLQSTYANAKLTLSQTQDLSILQGWLKIAANQFVEAEAVLTKALEEFPSNIKIHETLYRVYNVSGQHDKALKTANRILELTPQSSQALLDKASSLMMLEKYDLALAPLDKVLSLSTNRLGLVNRTARINRAIALLKGNQMEAARDQYLELKEDLPTLYKIDFGLAQVYEKLGEEKLTLESYQSYLSRAPESLRTSEEFLQAQNRVRELAAKLNP